MFACQSQILARQCLAIQFHITDFVALLEMVAYGPRCGPHYPPEEL